MSLLLKNICHSYETSIGLICTNPPNPPLLEPRYHHSDGSKITHNYTTLSMIYKHRFISIIW